MMFKNPIIVSFLVAGFFVLSMPDEGFSGILGSCVSRGGASSDTASEGECFDFQEGVLFCEDGEGGCEVGVNCACQVAPSIPTALVPKNLTQLTEKVDIGLFEDIVSLCLSSPSEPDLADSVLTLLGAF